MAKRLDAVRDVRLEKLEKLKAQGVNPYTAHTQRTHTAEEAKKEIGQKVVLAGRVWAWREHGGSVFSDLLDFSGQIQLFFSRDALGVEIFDNLSLIDLGDFVNIEGEVFTTQAGEITVRVEKCTLLTKALRPIPSTWYGIKDPEIRLRKRYLDLMLNPSERDLFVKKSKFWTSVRQFLIQENFLEVETPALEAIPGGADATPFITHHEALDQDFYLRISLELYQKRALVGGFEKVFEIGKIFRNEGIDQEHLQDYLQMEFYWAYADYNDLMSMTQKMYQQIVQDTMGTLKTTYKGNEIDWSGDWPRVDYSEAFKNETGLDLETVTEDELRQYAKENKIPVEAKVGKGRLIDSIYKKTVRPKLIQPTFLINHPVEVSPLAKRMEDSPEKVERMQILIGGTEVGNGFSELNDPIDQYNRFKEQQELLESGDAEAQRLDTDYVEALEYGMPPAAGFGFSQRLFAVITDRPIRETVMFPPMKEDQQDLPLKEVPSFTPTKNTGGKKLTREEAIEILNANMESVNLRKHCLAVAAVMKALAVKLEGDPETWEIAGILHDADYEKSKENPQMHTKLVFDWLKEHEVDDTITGAILAHGWGFIDGNPEPKTKMEWAIYTADELTGFITAVTLVRPEKSLAAVDLDAIMKKWKEKSFASGVHREQIELCEEKLGIPLPEFITIALEAMKGISKDLGL